MGGQSSKRMNQEFGKIAAELKAINEKNRQLEEDVKIAREKAASAEEEIKIRSKELTEEIALESHVKKSDAKVDKVRQENEDRARKLEEDVKIAREKATIAEEESKIRSETMRQELEKKEIDRKRWMQLHQHIHKKYTDAEKQVQELKKQNEFLREKLEETRGMSILDKVKLAVDTDSMLEDKIRSVIKQDPKMQKDFQRHFLRYEPGEHEDDTGSSGIESDGCGQVESDSAGRIESDGICDSDDDVDSACYDLAEPIDDDDLEASVAIAYVLSKMHYERQ